MIEINIVLTLPILIPSEVKIISRIFKNRTISTLYRYVPIPSKDIYCSTFFKLDFKSLAILWVSVVKISLFKR